MSITADKYSVLYNIAVNFIAGDRVINMSSSDIVSIAYICNYDTMTYPIIRIRIYTDLENIQYLCDKPDEDYVKLSFDGNVYMMSDNESPQPVAPASSIYLYMKCYIENKNIPTSVMDQYKDGIKTKNDLNENIKFPLEIYCYDYDKIHRSKSVVPAIYKNMSLDTVIRDLFSRVQNEPIIIDELDNLTKYEQILLPGLNVMEALAYMEMLYGIHSKGTQVFCDVDKTYVSSIDTTKSVDKVIPIFVTSAKNNTDLVGLRKSTNQLYQMFTLASNVSVITESDIEKTLNGALVTDINYKTGELNSKEYDPSIYDPNLVYQPSKLHPYKNIFVSNMLAAMVNERITRIDASGVGYDVFTLKNNSRYNLVFESPIRGFDINKMYRASFAVHTFTNMNSDLFIANSTFKMCTN